MDEPIITCPVCGQQFLPAEIYIPEEFFGRPTEVIRDDAGKIEFHLGPEMNLDEEFVCEHCGTAFTVHAKLSFETSYEAKDSEHVTYFNNVKKSQLKEEQLFNLDD